MVNGSTGVDTNSRAMAEAEAAVLKAKYFKDGGEIVEKDGD
jgi:hypothetical protein